jgi:N-acetylglucosamine malate deacetylase 1
MKSVLAIAAHPDDIEIMMAGTLLRLRDAGWAVHYFNLSTGNCGSMTMDAAETTRVRGAEAQTAASLLGATYYPPVANDLEIIYSADLLRKVAAVVRMASPQIVLTHALQDYMEDHMETARLAVTAAFSAEIRNFQTTPPVPALVSETGLAVYHALPHGLRDGLRRAAVPELIVDISDHRDAKRAALAAHRSQQDWLQASQGMNSYLATMEETGAGVGKMVDVPYGEGWNRHLHIGMSATEIDPLTEALEKHIYKLD